MSFFIALIIVCFAGFIDGSFAGPSKYMKRWNEENIWLIFSILGFFVIPLSYVYLTTNGNLFYILDEVEQKYLYFMIIGGLAFGIGQIFQCIAFRHIGLAVTFVINISIGTAGTALIPMFWHPDYIGSMYSLFQFIGSAIFIMAVIIGSVAGYHRDEAKVGHAVKTSSKSSLFSGIFLSILAGIGSAFQGLSYTYTNPAVSTKGVETFGLTHFVADNISWVVIFNCAFIPYAAYYCYLLFKRKSFSKYTENKTGKYWLFTLFMGACIWIPIILFSKAADMIGGSLAPTIAWPLFMIFIVFSSNIWSYFAHEWKHAGKKAITEMLFSLSLFVIAIVVFSVSSKYIN